MKLIEIRSGPGAFLGSLESTGQNVAGQSELASPGFVYRDSW